jgi:hypothetical protein
MKDRQEEANQAHVAQRAETIAFTLQRRRRQGTQMDPLDKHLKNTCVRGFEVFRGIQSTSPLHRSNREHLAHEPVDEH